MYYFKQVEQNIQKYEISFDIKKLNMLKHEIIDKYSIIEHKEIEKDKYPLYCDIIFSTKEYGYENLDWVEKNKHTYLYIYDKVIYHPLVVSINELIDGDTMAIKNIFETEYDNKDEMIIDLNKKIEKLSDAIDKIPNTNFKRKRKKLNELEELVKQLKACNKRSPITPYYKKVQNLIKFDLVDTLSITEIDRINDFFSTSNKDEKIINIKKLNLSKQ